MKDKKPSRNPNDSLENVIFYYSTQVVCAVLGLSMLFSAYDKACTTKILPSDLCRWSTQPNSSIQVYESPDMADLRKSYR